MRLIGTMVIMLAVALLLVASPALANDRELRVAETLITNPPSQAASTFFVAPAVPSGAIRSLEDRGVR